MKNNRTTRNRLITTLAKSTLIVLMFALVFASVLSVSFGVDSSLDVDINNNVAYADENIDIDSSKTVSLLGDTPASDIYYCTNSDKSEDNVFWHYAGDTTYHYLRIQLSENIQALINAGTMKGTVNVKYRTYGGDDEIWIYAWYGDGTYSDSISFAGELYDDLNSDEDTNADIFYYDTIPENTSVITISTTADDHSWLGFGYIDCGLYEASINLTYTPSFDGSGTSSSPWQLKTREDFDELSLMVRCGFVTSDKYFKVVPASGNTIDFEYDNKFIPIGGVDTDDDTKASEKDSDDVALYTFKGTLDGNSSQILNLANKLS